MRIQNQKEKKILSPSRPLAAYVLLVSFLFSLLRLDAPILNASDVRDIVFPIYGPASYSNDFGDPRSGGRTHQGNDIFGYKHQPLLAAVDGTVWFVGWPEPSYGYAIFLRGEDGYRYWYLHINNDTPGTDDGMGGGRFAYAPGMERGASVRAGQVIGWMGDSGNAEGTSAHLHFEIHRPSDNKAINPFESLRAATHVPAPVSAPVQKGEIVPYGDSFQGGANIAIGDIRPKTLGEELVVGTGKGGGPNVRVYSADDTLLSWFFAYDEGFHGGVDVAVGDLDGNGKGEIITAPGPGGGPHVRVFDSQGNVRLQFFAYAETFRGGVRVTAADLDGDGNDEIITGAGPGGGPHVRIFSGAGELIDQFFAYHEGFRGGIDVAAVGGTDSSKPRIITGAGPGGGPHVRIFTPSGNETAEFFPYAPSFPGGVRVDAANIVESSEAPEIVVAPASRGGPDLRVYSLRGNLASYETVFEPWWTGGYDVAAGTGVVQAASGADPRRVSVRDVID